MSQPDRFSIKQAVAIAYRLKGFARYQRFKSFFYDLLENDSYPYKRWFDLFMIFIILSSVIILVVEVKEPVPLWLDHYDLYFVTSVFIVEYLLRMWVYSDVHSLIIKRHEESQFLDHPMKMRHLVAMVLRNKWGYVSSPSAIIDLIAILPSYRQIRILRILVLFRAFKMLRYARSLSSFLFILKSKKFELITLLTLTAFFVFIAGIMLYVFEGDGDNPNIHNLFEAFYWALVTISTVGYGDISPVTPEGRIVSMMIILTGVGLIAFMTSIIVSSFSERLVELREGRVMQEVGKKSNVVVLCGFGTMGKKVAEGLQRENVELIVLDSSEENAREAHSRGYKSICTDATQAEVFRQIRVAERVSHVLCLTPDDEQNAFIAINVKSLAPDVPVTARCSDREVAAKLRYVGIDHVVIPEEITAMMGVVYAREPVAFETLRSIVTQKTHSRIDEIKVKSGGDLDNQFIGELSTLTSHLIVLGIVRSDEDGNTVFMFNENDEAQLQAGDDLVVLGHETAVSHFKRKVSS